VTNAEFAAYLEATGTSSPSHVATEGFNHPQQPVVGISWQDAQAYVRWLAEVTGKPYRLPTDAEWEYAARGGRSGCRFPWGDELAEEYACHGGRASPTKVGQYAANGFALHDMIGTVWEWCADRFNDVARRSTAINAPTGRPTDDNRVLRGGSYVTTNVLNLWIAYRHEDPVDLRHHVLGMRVACDES
jgi:formylglycine-generating enzyme required for sulfatase activity